MAEINVRQMDDEELARLSRSISDEMQLRNRVNGVLAAQQQKTRELEEIAAALGVQPFYPVPHFGHLPGAVVVWEDSKWRNISGASLVNDPGEYPIGWQLVEEPTEEDGE